MENLQLRDVTESDLPTLFEFQRDAEANLMAAFPARDIDAFLAHWRTEIRGKPAVVQKAIVSGGALVGDIVSWEQDGKQLVGYWIGKEYWGRGFATRSLTEFLTLFRARPLHAYVAKHNAASIRVLEKCGFKLLEQSRTYSKVHGREIDDLLMIRSKK